jgi:hypothetical protein
VGENCPLTGAIYANVTSRLQHPGGNSFNVPRAFRQLEIHCPSAHKQLINERDGLNFVCTI